MKKLWLLLLLMAAPVLAAQPTQTPNLGLNIIAPGTVNWDTYVNQNFTILDAKVPTLDLACSDGQIPIWQTGKFSLCGTPTAAVNVTSNYAWTGTHTFALAPTITGKAVCLADGTNCPSAGAESDPVITKLSGIITSNGTTAVARSMATANASNIAITNPTGGGGNPTWDVGPNVALTTRSFAATTGDFNFTNASSFTFPLAPGAAPTASGRCSYDTTANRLKCGFNGSTVILATTAEIQPLNANLTAMAGLTGANNTIPVFTAASTLTTATLPTCLDSGGQHLNYDTTSRTFSCGTSSTGGLSGMSTAKFLIATGATTADTSGNLSQAAGVINASGGFTVGDVSTNYLSIDTTGITGAKTWTPINFSGTIRPSTGALTPGNMVTTNSDGQLIDGGAAGTGTWTDSSTNTGTDKTLVATGAGGTNTITVPLKAYWDAAALTPDGTQCAEPVKTTINSGPTTYVMLCADNAGSIFDGHVMLTQAVTTVTFTLTVNDVDSSAHHFAGDFKAMCRNNGTTVNATWGTAQAVDITMTTANNNYTGTTAAVTPNGTCSAGATLFWKFTMNAGTNTDDGDGRIIGVLMQQAS